MPGWWNWQIAMENLEMPTIRDTCHVCKCSLPRSVCPRSVEEGEMRVARGEHLRMSFYRQCPWERDLKVPVS